MNIGLVLGLASADDQIDKSYVLTQYQDHDHG